MYIVFINCDLFPFISWIISGKKLFETRNRNTLKSLIGKTVFLAETGKGKRPVIRCIATIESKLSNVQKIPAFVPCEGKRYGFSYMEYTGKQK